eukprot:9461921-Lingulodinium_polyedra.AAC.1
MRARALRAPAPEGESCCAWPAGRRSGAHAAPPTRQGSLPGSPAQSARAATRERKEPGRAAGLTAEHAALGPGLQLLPARTPRSLQPATSSAKGPGPAISKIRVKQA